MKTETKTEMISFSKITLVDTRSSGPNQDRKQDTFSYRVAENSSHIWTSVRRTFSLRTQRKA